MTAPRLMPHRAQLPPSLAALVATPAVRTANAICAASDMRIRLSAASIRKIEKDVQDAFVETITVLDREMTAVINDPNAFPGFSGQDLVDTGKFEDSQTVQVTRNLAIFLWQIDYALLLHEGYVLRNGQRQPGRPWTKVAMQRKDPQATFNSILRAKLNER